MITKTQLQQLATAQSYSRGEAYYRSGTVRKIKQNGRTFAGKVYGSEAYDVTLTFRNKEPISIAPALTSLGASVSTA